MSQRLLSTTNWLWCVLVLHAPLWRPTSSAVRTPPGEPSTIEAQAKFFQDFFSVQLSPYKIEFGHVCEDPNTWEQRYEKKDFENHRDMGKVRWGDKKGGYGEHYWDLNHAGNAHNHGDDGYDDDDGSYHEDTHDAYDEPSEQSPNYDTEYTPEENSLEENNRAKRAHTRHSVETQRQEKVYGEEARPTQREKVYEEERRPARQKKVYEEESNPTHQEKTHEGEGRPTRQEKVYEEESNPIQQERIYEEARRPRRPKTRKNRKQYKVNEEEEDSYQTTTHKPIVVDNNEEDIPKTNDKKEKNDVVLVIDHRNKVQPKETTTKIPERKSYVPYEGEAGVRQHYHSEATAAASVPRLFLEPSTGHIVDRATGQAYVLQPVAQNVHYN